MKKRTKAINLISLFLILFTSVIFFTYSKSNNEPHDVYLEYEEWM